MNQIKEQNIDTMDEKSGWIKVCAADEIPENGGEAAFVNGKQYAIFNFTRRNEWYATDNMCPHKMQMALSRGMIGSQEDEPKVACPYHKKTFSLKTGNCLSGENYSIRTYSVKIENGFVYIKV